MRDQHLSRVAASMMALAAVPALALVLAAVGLAAVGLPARKAVKLEVMSRDPYVNKSSYHATEVEPDTFSFGKTIVAAFQAGRFYGGGAANIGWATSSNGGKSWMRGFLPGTTRFSTPKGRFARADDPSVAYDALHKVWLIGGLPITNHPGGPGIFVNRSTDGGIKWSPAVIVAYARRSQSFDKPWITCDDSTSSPYYGSCYAEWDSVVIANHRLRLPLHMVYSRDGGLKWRQSTVPEVGGTGGQPVVQPDGNVVMPIVNGRGTAIESFVSTDGGLRYGRPTRIARLASHIERGDLRSPALPTAAVDGAGRVFVAWADCRFRSSCSANDIVFSSSADGVHWSVVKRVPIDTTTSDVDHFLPGLGAATNTSGKTARLALTYYYYPHARCTVATCLLDVGYVASSDGGASWSGPIRLAGPMRLKDLPRTLSGYMVGDYISTSVVAGIAGDPALPMFAVGLPVRGTTCRLGHITSCDEPMELPARGLPTAPRAARRTVADPVLSTRSDPSIRAPLTYH